MGVIHILIQEEYRTNRGQARYLLDYLRKNPHKFGLFIEALRHNGQQHIVDRCCQECT